MAEFTRIPVGEAQRIGLPPRRAVQEEYRQYVRSVTAEVAGRIELGEGDKSISERAKLKAAAKAEGLNLEIKRQDNALVFWLSDEPVVSKRKGIGSGRRP